MPQRHLSAAPRCAAHKKTARAGGIFLAVKSRSSAAGAVARDAIEGWWSQAGSNRRPRECHSRALPSELWPQFAIFLAAFWETRAAARRRQVSSSFSRRLLALLFGLGVFERDEFGIRGLRHDHLGLRHGRGARDRRRRRRLGPRARWRWNDDRYRSEERRVGTEG